MGLMLGKVDGPTMIVMDSFALPVEGTETRVNAQAQAYEYMTAYVEAAKQVLYIFIIDLFLNFSFYSSTDGKLLTSFNFFVIAIL